MAQIYYSKSSGNFTEEEIKAAQSILQEKYGFVPRSDYQPGAYALPHIENLFTDISATIVSFRKDGIVAIETPSNKNIEPTSQDQQILDDLVKNLHPTKIQS